MIDPQALALTALETAAAAIQQAKDALSIVTVNVNASGLADVTDSIQAYLNKGGKIQIPAGQYLIDPAKSLRVVSGTRLTLDPEAVLICKPNALERNVVLLVEGVSEVEVYGGRFVGDRLQHTYAGTGTHEWGMGIAVYGSQNVIVDGARTEHCTGDGIVVGRDSVNVTVRNVVSTKNRRQALTIGRSRTVRVYDSEFSFTGALGDQLGTKPRAGIDIEPDSTGSALCDDVRIERCKIVDNESAGIETMADTSTIRNVTIKDCEIARNGDGIHAQKCIGLVVEDNYVHDQRGYGVKVLNGTEATVTGNTFQHNLLRVSTYDRPAELVADGFVSARDLKLETTAGVCSAKGNTYK